MELSLGFEMILFEALNHKTAIKVCSDDLTNEHQLTQSGVAELDWLEQHEREQSRIDTLAALKLMMDSLSKVDKMGERRSARPVRHAKRAKHPVRLLLKTTAVSDVSVG